MVMLDFCSTKTECNEGTGSKAFDEIDVDMVGGLGES